MSNPFRVGSTFTLSVPPCVVVIFGATGDLTHRKLVPAFYNLGVDGLLPANFSLVGFARRDYSHEYFREQLTQSVGEYSRRKPLDESLWRELVQHSYYCRGEFDDADAYKYLRELLESIDREAGHKCNRIFYFATSPDHFTAIAQNLAAVGLLENSEVRRSSARVVVEKPFGNDLDSAKELNKSLLSCMDEDQIYRIDHYLGKETVQNLLVFRFANGIFEPIWNHKYIDHVEISVCESIGVGSRAGYFDRTGIVRDMVQNHLLQLLCLVALEPPVAFEADAVRDEKVKVLRSLRRFTAKDVFKRATRGQYVKGYVGGEEVGGYHDEPGVRLNSKTETYSALEVYIDNWRWAGVPFYLRAGKRLAKRITEITIEFKQIPHRLFAGEDVREVTPNILSFQIQPDEGVALSISSKPPGPRVRVQPVKMDFSYGSSFGVEPPEAYERLLLDCIRGDATLFTRKDEIEEAWDFVGPIIRAWEDTSSESVPPIYEYESGSWGPDVADEMLSFRLNRGWRRL